MTGWGDHILLVGYRGTGKSSVGRLLAEALQMSFVDMDQVIVEEAGCTISKMVENHGWPCFRGREKKLLLRLSQGTGLVIATGGGVVLDEENRLLMKKMGQVIWLKADIDTIVQRLQQDVISAEQRPAFSEKSLRDETETVLCERTPLYDSVSDMSIETSGRNIRECVDEIMRIVHKRGGS
jgi:shikimate kinase